MSFSDDWNKESENAIKAQREIVKVIAIELFSGVITGSPVGNASLWKRPNSAPPSYTGGSFRSNWFLTEKVESIKYYPDNIISEAQKVSEVSRGINNSMSSSYILSNNAPYAKRIENGWSSQSPIGLVAPNVTRVNAQIPRIEAVVNKKYGV